MSAVEVFSQAQLRNSPKDRLHLLQQQSAVTKVLPKMISQRLPRDA